LAEYVGAQGIASRQIELFEKKIRPVLIQHCYQCHSDQADQIEGGLRLDLKSGWQLGGDSGQPAIVPGDPDRSPLLLSIRHADGSSAMPPKQPRLPESMIQDLTQWIQEGAVDPREGQVNIPDKAGLWEAQYQQRLDWWSLKPIQPVSPPSLEVSNLDSVGLAQDSTTADQGVSGQWCRNDVDRFILVKLQDANLRPAEEADRHVLVRRLSFALTGLPPSPELIHGYLSDESADAYETLVSKLLHSPHFGERWARHWMDVIHYTDTHGYEWDVPVKNAWRYRDYLIRAFNSDISYQQLVLEQIAGDLLPPRVDAQSGVNESLIGPMMLRMGERRHGDNAALEGISQEAVANMIDTLGKAFLGATLACAQCHNHKLDAIEQRDYYSLAGMLMSARYSARPIDAVDTNQETIAQLREIKAELRGELAQRWLRATEPQQSGGMVDKLRSIPADQQPSATFPETIVEFWKRSLGSPISADEFHSQTGQRQAANQSNLKVLADFATSQMAMGWRWEGLGMQYGLVGDGELVVADEGPLAILHLLPAGRYSHVWSPRLAGSLQSPQLDPTQPITFSMQMVSGKFASLSFIVDRAINPERLQFPSQPYPQWQTLTGGNFDSLEGTVDKAPRRVYLELATKSLNNYFPPRVGYGGVKESELDDERSWFGVSKVYQHEPGKGPQDDLRRFSPLFDQHSGKTDWAERLMRLVHDAALRWNDQSCTEDDVYLLNDALRAGLLPAQLSGDDELTQLVDRYRIKERELRPDRTVGSMAQWDEGGDERIAVRGVYTDLGETVPRGRTRLLNFDVSDASAEADVSGRLHWARQLVSSENPLVARVYVNRVWHYLFGAGLVRTTDDLGHLGEQPSHPELLDYLAAQFTADGWSTKRLIQRLVTSATWRQSSRPESLALQQDPENRLWHSMPMRRLDAEAIRDSLLSVSGRLDTTLFGPPIEPYRTAEDSQKRLFKGPLDGQGRRSIYLEMTLMEPPRFLALFNQPIPKQTMGRRDVTNTPDQALAMLNDPMVIELARHWSTILVTDGAQSIEQRAEKMITRSVGRQGTTAEVDALSRLIRQSAEMRGVSGDLLTQPLVWQDAAHAVFNLKEFIYVR
jgi:cytochrome c553